MVFLLCFIVMKIYETVSIKFLDLMVTGSKSMVQKRIMPGNISIIRIVYILP